MAILPTRYLTSGVSSDTTEWLITRTTLSDVTDNALPSIENLLSSFGLPQGGIAFE